MSVPVLVAVAWPYASGSRHIGHLAGAYLPADIYARYQRLAGNDVLMLSGSDVHGTPITVRAEREGVTPSAIVNRYHGEIKRQWDALAMSWDLYTTTGTANHAAVTQDMFLRQLNKGLIYKRTSEQFYDELAERFLPDRYIEGTCPHCGYHEARGDQCENCGATLDPVDLIEPRSKISGAKPVLRSTEHFYFRYSAFTNELSEWLKTKTNWRPHVMNSSLGWTSQGLMDRAITRDLTWGVKLPVEGLGQDKRIYVWYDAVIGYLSASKEWASDSGDAERWKHWWQNDEAHHVYFMAKDNIAFHTLFWPAQLMAYGDLHLPDIVAANQYVTFAGGKASASRGVGLTIDEGLKLFEPDALRYALAATLPEHADTEISLGEIKRRVNDELVATWGNLVNRVMSLAQTILQGVQPDLQCVQPDTAGVTDMTGVIDTNGMADMNGMSRSCVGEQLTEDTTLLACIDNSLVEQARQIERVELRASVRTAMNAAAKVNTYLNATEPWRLAKTDLARAKRVLGTAVEAVAGVRVGLAPYLPVSTAALDDVFGSVESWKRPPVPPGQPLPKLKPLFAKVELPDASPDVGAGKAQSDASLVPGTSLAPGTSPDASKV